MKSLLFPIFDAVYSCNDKLNLVMCRVFDNSEFYFACFDSNSSVFSALESLEIQIVSTLYREPVRRLQ